MDTGGAIARMNNEAHEIVGARIRDARIAQGKTLKDVAFATRVSLPQISEMERGISLGTFVAVVTVAQTLNLSLDQLMEGVKFR